MIPGNVILVAVDNSSYSQYLVTYAKNAARATGKAVYLVHVVDPREYNILHNSALLEKSMLAEEKLATYRMKGIAKTLEKEGVSDVLWTVCYGDARHWLVKLANLANVSTVVVGAKGAHHTTFNRVGHMARYVMSWADKNVVIARETSKQGMFV
ncbi:universal stress protein [Levilactobacillus bambusae]|uniref:UspA domain-containing protein n=1 Tax=Levilactobacillus bambusae TaxID=2024736 RepID=A0A2V1MYZ7_9LACO|nr:universal stress protein [Levilactobacillus bambusae]PWG00032.1 hypothetical protein DCM90_03590 [Levilactobacillus bambusae]